MFPAFGLKFCNRWIGMEMGSGGVGGGIVSTMAYSCYRYCCWGGMGG